MLDQRALELEGADPVARGLEHVVGAADIGDVAVGVARADVAGVVEAVAHRLGGLLGVVGIALHQRHRPPRQVDAELAFVAGLAVRIEQHHRVARQRLAHRARLDRQARRIADHRGGLGLAEAVADLQAPGGPHLLDHLGVERLAGRDRLAQRGLPVAERLLDEHAPDGGRRAQRLHAVLHHGVEHRRAAEARVVVDEHTGLRVERREEAAPGVLGPARRADRPVHVARLQAEPVHRAQVADRIALARMAHELGLGGGARGEVLEQRRVDAEHGRRGEHRRGLLRVAVVDPSGRRLARRVAARRAGEDAADAVECIGRRLGHARRAARVGQDPAHAAACEAVGEVGAGQQQRRRDHHHAELDRREHGFPQRHLVAQHQQHPVARLGAEARQEARDLGRAPRELGIAQLRLGTGLLDDVQCRRVVVGGDRVEPVGRPVEALERGPCERGAGGIEVGAVREQQVAGGAEAVVLGHVVSFLEG